MYRQTMTSGSAVTRSRLSVLLVVGAFIGAGLWSTDNRFPVVTGLSVAYVLLLFLWGAMIIAVANASHARTGLRVAALPAVILGIGAANPFFALLIVVAPTLLLAAQIWPPPLPSNRAQWTPPW
jgi:hypothetical protein